MDLWQLCWHSCVPVRIVRAISPPRMHASSVTYTASTIAHVTFTVFASNLTQPYVGPDPDTGPLAIHKYYSFGPVSKCRQCWLA